MTTRLAGRRAIVTGAGAGFGLGIAQRLAADGARVACVDIDLAAAQAAAATMPGAIAVACDVSGSTSVQALAAEVQAAFGGCDILVNNAALTQKPARIAKTAEADIDRLLAVNVKSLYHMAVHVLPLLRAAGGGSVVNVSSVGALRPRPGMSWYNATKSAVLTLTQSMAAEYAADRIRVNAVAPVAGRTRMLDTMFGAEVDAGIERLLAGIPLGRLADPTDIAAAVAFLVSDDAAFITGVTLPVDGGRLVG